MIKNKYRMHTILFAFILTIAGCMLTASITSAASDPYILNVTIDDEYINFAGHNESEIDGNWIVVDGGEKFTLPSPINLTYKGINTKSFILNGKEVNITLDANEYTITYPFQKHPMFIDVPSKNDVNLSFYGSTDFAHEDVDIYLLKVTRNNITDLYNNAKEADTGSFRSMLENAYAKSLDNTLNGDGDIEGFMFNGVEAGDYAALVLLNSTGPQSQNLSILSATAFEVLEYDSTITASSSIGSGDSLNVNVELIDAPNATTYTYAAVLIRDDVYRAEMVLSSNGNKMETNFTLNGEYILEAFDLVGLDHSNINANDVQNKVTSLIGPDNGTVIIKTVDSNQTSLSLTTLDLPADKYYLIVGVYKSGDYLVAFEQNDIIINTPLVVEPLAIRTLPKHVETGEQFTVRMEFSDYGTAGLLTETIPSGFTFEDSTHYFKQDGQVITFLLLENDVIEYTVTASETEGDYQFDGTIKDFNKVEATVGGNEWVGVGPFDPHIYDFSHDGSIEKEEVIEAIKDYLIYDRITKDNVIKVIKAYFGI